MMAATQIAKTQNARLRFFVMGTKERLQQRQLCSPGFRKSISIDGETVPVLAFIRNVFADAIQTAKVSDGTPMFRD